jgi:signal peptidase
VSTASNVLNRIYYTHRNQQPLSEEAAWRNAGILLVCLAAAYWMGNYVLPGRMSPDLQVYVVRPLIWGGIGLFAFELWRRITDRPVVERTFLGLALLAGVFNVSALICAGVLFGFGHSPYSRQIFHMTENLWYIGTLIFGLEMSRAYLLTVWSRKNATLAFIATALIIGALWFAPGQYDVLIQHDHQRAVQVFGRTFMPAASESLMTTFLAMLGGPLPAFVYHFSLESYRWVSPILPRLDWTIATFVGTLAPAVAMLIVRDAYFGVRAAEEPAAEAEAAPKKGGFSPLLYLGLTVIVALIWLDTGMLGVKPALVSGPSMKPYLGPGDMIITKDVGASSLKVGDVVKYRGAHGDVIHRVVEIKNGPAGLTFITQGDNNNVADPPVTPDQIEGKLVLKIPELGWIPIEIRKVLP